MQSLDKRLLHRLSAQLASLCTNMHDLETSLNKRSSTIHPRHQRSARNLAHYLALRQHDLRRLQEQLTLLGLSSLGRAEGHVLSTVLAVQRAISALLGQADLQPTVAANPQTRPVEIAEGAQLLAANTDTLLGPAPPDRHVRIMVTMPSEAATDYQLVRDLLQNGMDCMRINCAHDGPEAWLSMIQNLHKARQATGHTCRILMDIPGPKLRTGPIEPGPAILKCRPTRDIYGRVTHPAQIWLTPASHPEPAPPSATASLTLSDRFLQNLLHGDEIHLHDARRSPRTLRITRTAGTNRWAEARHTIYFKPGLQLRATHHPAKAHNAAPKHFTTRIASLPPLAQTLLLKPGDTLLLRRGQTLGKQATRNRAGKTITPAEIGISLPEALDHAQPGQPVWLDDGKIGGIIRAVAPTFTTVEITQARPEGENLAAEKGINLPETQIPIPALTQEDIATLPFIVQHADLIGYSFVRTPDDVQHLVDHLKDLNGLHLGIILKIETRHGFDNLPSLILTAMQARSIGVMIARGDLAVECGYQRLAEVQEEILWICEAAHIPVVWATQVLESLARKGIPSRSEISDAAMGERAECVMLNKGPYIVTAVKVLADILTRMQAHHQKKQSMLRQLHLAGSPAPSTKKLSSA